MLSDTEEPPILEPKVLTPLIIISDDDDNDVEGPVMILDDKEPESSIGKGVKKLKISKSSSLTDDPETTPQVSKRRMVFKGKKSTDDSPTPTAMGQPRKKRCKTKNLSVTPGKPIKPSMLVPPNVPSLHSVPARPASPFPPSMSVLSGLPALPPNPPPFQQLPSGQGLGHRGKEGLSGTGGGMPKFRHLPFPPQGLLPPCTFCPEDSPFFLRTQPGWHFW